MNEKSYSSREQMNVVIIGHVDHGKSTVIGRLLADTNSLPEGKLKLVKAYCRANSRPFEYSFLLDALKDEQSQGITIDTARCFFQTKKRDYIIIDAPGHIEFLKNMITGAARAEAAILVIDAKEGVRENSRRHGYMASMLGIKQLLVCVNKMDLVDYSEEKFHKICKEYQQFLEKIDCPAVDFIPISAREGDHLIGPSKHMPWYQGQYVLQAIDNLSKEKEDFLKPLRFPVQDVYKFTDKEDDRRLVAGRIESGSLKVGDEVLFYPSGKESKIASIEEFNVPAQQEAFAGQSIAVTLEEQIYIVRGDLMVRKGEVDPEVSTCLRANLFWLGRRPMVKNKKYTIKCGTARSAVWLTDVVNVLDASDLKTVENKQQIDRHDVADCVFELYKPLAFDENGRIAQTGRFVIVDQYEIVGGGIIRSALQEKNSLVDTIVTDRHQQWDKSDVTTQERVLRYRQKPCVIVLTGPPHSGKQELAKRLEKMLFEKGHFVYSLGFSNSILDALDYRDSEDRSSLLFRLGDLSYWFTQAGMVLILNLPDCEEHEFGILRKLADPGEVIVIGVGQGHRFEHFQYSISDFSDVENTVEHLHSYLKKQVFYQDFSI